MLLASVVALVSSVNLHYCTRVIVQDTLNATPLPSPTYPLRR